MQMKLSGKQDVYLEIAEKYKEYIKMGLFGDGERLPSVREAAGELGVNPNTVARAYERLESEGFIRILPKKGVFVSLEDKKEKEKERCDEPDRRAVIYALRDMGISKQTLLDWIEEVYEND